MESDATRSIPDVLIPFPQARGRCTMRSAFNRLALAALALCVGIAGQASAGTITYSIANYPADQNGATLSGTITTDGVSGPLASSDILAWSWTITPAGGTPFTYTSSDIGATSGIAGAVASPSSITLALPPGTDFYEFALYNGQTAAVGLEYERSSSGNLYFGKTSAGIIWNDPNPAMGGNDPWIIATAAVPEPSTLTLLGIAAAGLALFGRRTLSPSPARQR
jgi:PEP-CTERM motif-containing protein